MGLIDDIRKKKDSWMARFEEHRQDKDEPDDYSSVDREKEEEEILRNRKMVGVFPRKE
ncbi:MAG: hypothetical protein HYW01_11645 [Deltaproteobacteria bacterium]|nr:hypothetical protein [Deltaproteobacteria bacterium]